MTKPFQFVFSHHYFLNINLYRVLCSEMNIFSGCLIALELGTNIPYKKKQQLRKTVTDNGGVVSFIITKKVGVFTQASLFPCLSRHLGSPV